MDHSKDDNSIISEDLWRAWAEKNKRREEAMARKAKVFAGVVLILMAIGVGLYFLAVK
jgi:heme A synthase